MTKPTFYVEEDKILSSLFDEGMEYLHLNKPGSSPMYSERLLSLLSEDCYEKITVHDHFYLKEEYGLRGIHLDSTEADPPAGYKGHISRTCHSLSDLREAKRKSEYVLLANTFNKHTAKSTYTQEELVDAARHGLIDKKVYAWGGVNLDTLRMAKELGFGGAVVCDDLWSKFDIYHDTDFKELMSHFDKLRKVVG